MNNSAPKLQKCWTHKIASKIIPKMLKQPHFFYSQLSTLPTCKLLPFGLSFMIRRVAPTRSSTCYAYLITKIGNRNLQLKLRLHDAIYWLRFYLNSLIHNLSLSNSHNNVASIQKNRGDKLHHVTAA